MLKRVPGPDSLELIPDKLLKASDAQTPKLQASLLQVFAKPPPPGPQAGAGWVASSRRKTVANDGFYVARITH